MKTPRINDFDPKTPSLKSPLDGMPAIQSFEVRSVPQPAPSTTAPTSLPVAEPLAAEASPKTPLDGPPVSPPVRTDDRTPVRVKRTITRYAFELFRDQVETLKQFSLEEQLRGEKGSMSQMVREALDAYIAKRRRMEE